MKLGIVGLGKMGGNMARRLSRAGHEVVGYNRTYDAARAMVSEEERFTAARSLEDLVDQIPRPRAIWVMVPAGQPTEEVIERLSERLVPDDAVVDGGNSYYKDTVRRSEMLSKRGIHLVDSGTSGGVWGLSEGYCMMLGGDEDVIERIRPLIATLAPAPDKGWGRVGPAGAGHFVKMIHNGIEYGLMAAYAEGFEILRAKAAFELDLHRISQIWQHGSVIRSWLLDLAESALSKNPDLDGIAPWVADSGEGRWTVAEAIDGDIPAPIITLSLLMRLASRQHESYAAKMLSALRQEFGGHAVKSE